MKADAAQGSASQPHNLVQQPGLPVFLHDPLVFL
jgi:hypothetical protein